MAEKEQVRIAVPDISKLQQVDPEITQAMTDLVSTCTELVVKVAYCNCNDKEKCPVFQKARKIAEIIDRLMELRNKLPKTVSSPS